MAKKKAARKKSSNVTSNAVVIRGGEDWRDWLKGYAELKRTTTVGLIDSALAEMAKRDKYKPPPARY